MPPSPTSSFSTSCHFFVVHIINVVSDVFGGVVVTDVIIGVIIVISGFIDFVIMAGVLYVVGVISIVNIGVIDGGGSGGGYDN